LPTDDAFVRSNDADKNYGTSGDLRLRKTSSAELMAYLKFVVAGVSSVQSATLRLFVTGASNSGGEIYLGSNFLKGTTSPWNETNVIWPNAPEVTDGVISSLGAISQDTFVEFDLTAVISGDGVYTFAIRTTSTDLATYASKETSNSPQLLLNGGGGEPPSNAPVVSSFTPTSGPIGTVVTISGSNFAAATDVEFNGVAAEFNILSASHVRATVPNGASSGKITVINADGNATSAADFTVTTGGGGPQTLSFNSIEDAFVRSSNADNNYGGATNLRVRQTSETQIAFFKFNVSGLSGAATSAKLRLLCTDATDDGGEVYSVSNSWNEGGITWSSAPQVSGSPLSSVQAVNIGESVEWDVTLAVSADGAYSFAIRNNSSDAVYYSSKEGAQAPQLVVSTGNAAVATKLGDEELPEFDELTTEMEQNIIPEKLMLMPNYPNPFNAETTLEYGLPAASLVRLTIYNVRGQEVRVLVDEHQSAGYRKAHWDGKDGGGRGVASGSYFVRILAGNGQLNRKILLQK
jgi:hypothetical protein